MAPTSHILLRLDDGSLIGDAVKLGQHVPAQGNDIVRITAEQAFAVGRVGDAEIRRLERILSSLQSAGQSQNGMVSQEQQKKQRLNGAPGPDFHPKCSKIFQACLLHMGPQTKNIFWLPVNRDVVHDYYKIIKNPICFKDIDRKLQAKLYSSPYDFYADMKLLWTNCRTYNKPVDPVGKIGLQEEAFFEQQWAHSGYAQQQDSAARGKRATAGIAALKFDPEVYVPPSKPKASGAKATESVPARSAKRQPSTSVQVTSVGGGGNHEVTSGQQPPAGGGGGGESPINAARRLEIAGQLGALTSDEQNAHLMEQALQLIPERFMKSDEEGELELDFENIDNTTMKKLDAFLRRVAGGAASPTAMSLNPSVRLDEDSSEEDAQGGSDSD